MRLEIFSSRPRLREYLITSPIYVAWRPRRASSPTETLLRLLLPLNDQVWSTSQRRRRPIEPPRVGPKTSLNHSIGSSDGRCVQRAGTTKEFQRVARPLGQGEHADSFSVARVRPRTSKGITDLLLLNLVRLEAAGPSKKILITPPVSRATRTPRTPE
ncbi:hypothetical protein EVAR_47557_1 [Eumeta japonica]|uniref:Uncharacterized protein n=1 Tax=Eumeta variegata TaxID=151549 RepID=A0A4C1WQU5_EUMVA|nr:hypothetical protein EVAR_47557_1 [Eumeta japonica]